MARVTRRRRLRALDQTQVGPRSHPARSRPAGLKFAAASADKRVAALLLDEPRAALVTLEPLPSRGEPRRNLSRAPSPGASDRRPRFEENLTLLPECLDLAEGCGVTLTVETIRAGVGWPLTNIRAPGHTTHDAGRLALQNEVEASLDDDTLWSRVAPVHVKDFDETLRDGNEPGTPSSRAKAGSTSRPCSKPCDAAGIQALTLQVSAVTPEASRRESVTAAETGLTSRPWSLPFEVPARSGQNARP
jgi:hypothetical protein